MKYELVSLNVRIGGKLFRKGNKPILDDSKLNRNEIEAAYKAGFIRPVGTKAATAKEVREQYKKDQENKVSEKKAAKAKELEAAKAKEPKK